MVISTRSSEGVFWVISKSMWKHLGAAGVWSYRRISKKKKKKKILVFWLLVMINFHRLETRLTPAATVGSTTIHKCVHAKRQGPSQGADQGPGRTCTAHDAIHKCWLGASAFLQHRGAVAVIRSPLDFPPILREAENWLIRSQPKAYWAPGTCVGARVATTLCPPLSPPQQTDTHGLLEEQSRKQVARNCRTAQLGHQEENTTNKP